MVRLWADDANIPNERMGVLVFRTGLTGLAAELAEALPDNDLRDPDGLERTIAFFANHYEPSNVISGLDDFEAALYGTTRGARETLSEYILNKLARIARYEESFELDLDSRMLPNIMKARVVLKHANLD